MNSVKFSLLLLITSLLIGSCDSDLKKWDEYFGRTTIRSPNKLLSDYFVKIHNNKEFIILDLGAGNGSDSIYLVKKGFTVYAVDFFDEAIKSIHQNNTKIQ